MSLIAEILAGNQEVDKARQGRQRCRDQTSSQKPKRSRGPECTAGLPEGLV